MSEPAETIETESKELMPMEAFEAMADALRPLASGLEDFTVGSRVFSCFVAGDREDSALTKEGEHRITEMSSMSAATKHEKTRLPTVKSSRPLASGRKASAIASNASMGRSCSLSVLVVSASSDMVPPP